MKNGLIIDKYGQSWYKNDLLHREDGPAEEWNHGTKAWYINGRLHRLDGPAIEYTSGDKEWYIHDQLHRLDGPAIEFANGVKEWYFNDEYIDCNTNEEFLRMIKLKAFL